MNCLLNNQSIMILIILSPLYLPCQLFYLIESKKIIPISVNYIVVKNKLLSFPVVMHTSLSKGYQTWQFLCLMKWEIWNMSLMSKNLWHSTIQLKGNVQLPDFPQETKDLYFFHCHSIYKMQFVFYFVGDVKSCLWHLGSWKFYLYDCSWIFSGLTYCSL